jgi:hypothetical protein
MSNALFLPAASNANSSGRLTPGVINTIWNETCLWANMKGKTPYAARHAMGRHVMDKTGNVAAVQRQLGHNGDQDAEHQWNGHTIAGQMTASDLQELPLCQWRCYATIAAACWVGDYHLTGDTVQQNADGSISFVGPGRTTSSPRRRIASVPTKSRAR